MRRPIRPNWNLSRPPEPKKAAAATVLSIAAAVFMPERMLLHKSPNNIEYKRRKALRLECFSQLSSSYEIDA